VRLVNQTEEAVNVDQEEEVVDKEEERTRWIVLLELRKVNRKEW
jgi:hypothetical protein